MYIFQIYSFRNTPTEHISHSLIPSPAYPTLRAFLVKKTHFPISPRTYNNGEIREIKSIQINPIMN